MLIGYARVSTQDQTLDLQTDALTRAGCERTFTDVMSGAKSERPGLQEAMSHLRAGDTLVVWRLDRTLKHLIATITELSEQGIGSSAAHLASWVGLCPGNHQSAGKSLRGTTRKGDRWLRQGLIEAAQGAMRTKDTYLRAQGDRLIRRRGKKRAVVAVAHTLLVMAYHMLSRPQPYQDLGATTSTSGSVPPSPGSRSAVWSISASR